MVIEVIRKGRGGHPPAYEALYQAVTNRIPTASLSTSCPSMMNGVPADGYHDEQRWNTSTEAPLGRIAPQSA